MKAAVYTRISSDPTGQRLGVERQHEDCLKLCDERGWEAVVYEDNDSSASVGRRPQYEAMLADIRAGAVGAVVVYHLDRLHRRPIELEQFIALADEKQLALATVTGDVNLATDNGRLIARITGAVARAEVERKSARQKRALLQRAQAGKGWGGRAFGYTADDDLEPREAAAVRDAYTTVLHGGTLYSIAKAWNEADLVTAKGGNRWVGETVRRVLMNPRYAGIREYRGEHYPAAWGAIVTEDVWRAVVAILKDPSRRTGNSRVRFHMMTGLILCGECRRPMGVGTSHDRNRDKGQPRRKVYLCKNEGCRKLARDLDKVTKLVTDVMVERLSRDDAKELIVNREGPNVDALLTEAEAIRVQIETLPDFIDNEGWTAQQVGRRTTQLQEKLNAIEAQMTNAHDARLFEGIIGAEDVRAAWKDASLDRKRAMIDRLVVFTVNRTKRGRGWHPEHIGVEWREPH